MRWTQRRRARTRSQGGSPVSDHRAPDERRQSVRQNRVVLAPVAGVKSAEVLVSPTGFGKTINSPMTVTRRIRRRGEHGISRKTIVRGTPECSDCTCMLVCVFLCASCTRDRGCSKHPAFPAPSVFGRTFLERLGRFLRRGVVKSCLELDHRHCEERKRRSNPFFHFVARWIASRSLSSGAHSRTRWLATTVVDADDRAEKPWRTGCPAFGV
jgi:hypothetical protein